MHTSPLGFFALAVTAARGDLSCLVIDSSFTLVGEEDYRWLHSKRSHVWITVTQPSIINAVKRRKCYSELQKINNREKHDEYTEVLYWGFLTSPFPSLWIWKVSLHDAPCVRRRWKLVHRLLWPHAEVSWEVPVVGIAAAAAEEQQLGPFQNSLQHQSVAGDGCCSLALQWTSKSCMRSWTELSWATRGSSFARSLPLGWLGSKLHTESSLSLNSLCIV